jgi:hypothetical protein
VTEELAPRTQRASQARRSFGSSPLAIIDSKVIASWSPVPGLGGAVAVSSRQRDGASYAQSYCCPAGEGGGPAFGGRQLDAVASKRGRQE